MDHILPDPTVSGTAPPGSGQRDPDAELEVSARALLDDILAAEPAAADELANLTHRAALLQAAVLHRHPPPIAGLAETGALVAEHEELAAAAGDLTQALAAWWGSATKGKETAWTAGRRAAVAAAQTLHDDLRVHHAHERPS